jgi:hypothetical protein
MAMMMKNKYASTGVVGALALLASSSAWAEAFEHRTESSVQLAAVGGELTTLLQQEVLAGTWIITAKASLVSWGAADYVRCGLQANGELVDGSTAMIGEAGGMPAVTTLYNQKLSSPTAATTIALVCWHDSSVAGPFVDPGASLILSRVGDPPLTLTCEAPAFGECLPGFVLVPNGVVLPVDEVPENTVVLGTAPLPDGTDGVALAVCEEAASEPADACLAPEFIDPFQAGVFWHVDEGTADYPLLDMCTRAKPYRWCTTFGYCWCSANSGR